MKHKIAILVPTYQRKNDRTHQILTAMFDMLFKQIIPENISISVFVIGDYYENNDEFTELCNSGAALLESKMTVIYHNCNIHFRNNYFKIKNNSWCMGGINAVVTGLQMISDAGFDYYFHLDDDDYWYPEYINYVIKCLERYPESAFTICKGYYCNSGELPRANVTELFYNNYQIRKWDSIHASWVINMKLIGDELLKVYNGYLNQVLAIKTNPAAEFNFKPCDGEILSYFGKLQVENKIKALCLPEKYVRKETDMNIPE